MREAASSRRMMTTGRSSEAEYINRSPTNSVRSSYATFSTSRMRTGLKSPLLPTMPRGIRAKCLLFNTAGKRPGGRVRPTFSTAVAAARPS